LQDELGALLRLGIGNVAFVDAAALAEMLEPVGSLAVDLPTDVTDAVGKVVARSGATTMDATEAAAVLTARDPDVPAAEHYRAASAVWSAGQGVGEGAIAGRR
jgi:anionic cell wall polymer biosynthesis LytR-Cps2A-Psr (LCP) family protein